MAIREGIKLDVLIEPWPIVKSLCENLPVADLITLARTSSALRASLHGYEKLEDLETKPNLSHIRNSLNIGFHNTPYWQRLKQLAPLECCSKSHTRGPTPKPCRYCSRPICEACIVKSSLAQPGQNTFKNRFRYLCKSCWDAGNSSKSSRLPLERASGAFSKHTSDSHSPSLNEFCNCTSKDGFLCMECKDKQLNATNEDDSLYCYGDGCSNELEDDGENRKICLWCDKPLPKVGGSTRYAWSQKIIEARARNAASRQADLEEYNRKRQRLMRMSRRELRGNAAVIKQFDADIPQFVRHLDTINYRRYMPETAAPSGDAVYASKLGYWRYNKDFLLAVRPWCNHVPMPGYLQNITQQGGLKFARTNIEKFREKPEKRPSGSSDNLSHQTHSPSPSRPSILEKRSSLSHFPSICQNESADWYNLKAVMLEMFVREKMEFNKVKQVLKNDYDFEGTNLQYLTILCFWGFTRQDLNLSEETNAELEETFEQLDELDLARLNSFQSGLERSISTISMNDDLDEPGTTNLLDDIDAHQSNKKGFRRMSQLKLDLRRPGSNERRARQTINGTDKQNLIMGQSLSGPASPEVRSDSQPRISEMSFVDAYIDPSMQVDHTRPVAHLENMYPVIPDEMGPPDEMEDLTMSRRLSDQDPPPYAPGEWVWRDPE